MTKSPESCHIFEMSHNQPENKKTNLKSESVDKTFRRAAILGYCFGLFPCSSVILKEPAKNVTPHYLLIPTVVSVILYISSVIGTAFGLLLYLKEFRTVANISLAPTDKFALKSFLSALLISRASAGQFCLRKAKSIAILVQTLARYDKTFQIKSSAGFLNLTFITLIVGSVTNAVANTYVSWPVMYSAYKHDRFPTIVRLLGMKSPVVEFLHTFSGAIYGEISLMFLSSVILFLGRAISKRIEEIPDKLLNQSCDTDNNIDQTEERISKKAVALAAKKIKVLFVVKQEFESIFGTVMVMYVGFSIVILVTTFYTLANLMIYFHTKNTMNWFHNHEFLSILSVVLLTCFRLKAFVECGERLTQTGSSLSTRIRFINPTKCEKNSELAYLKQVSGAADFSFDAKGYFIMKRKLIPSILGAVVSFIVVLAQFKNDDGDEEHWKANNTLIN